MIKEIVGFPNYFVSSEGKIFKAKNLKMKGEILKPLAWSYTTNGYRKVNMQDEAGKLTSKCIHNIVYEAFVTDKYSVLTLLDGDKDNCRLENIKSLEDLVAYYNATYEGKNK